MKEGGGAIEATPRTHHVGKERESADGEVPCNLQPTDEMLSVGNGSGDLEDSREKEERTSTDKRIEKTTLPRQDDGPECTKSGTGALGPELECDDKSKSSLPQPHEANAATEEPSSEITCKNIPEECSDRTDPQRTSSDVDPSEAKISVACGDLESGLPQEHGREVGEKLDQKDASDVGVVVEKGEVIEGEGDKCTSADEGNKQFDLFSEGSGEESKEDSLLELESVEALMKSLEDQVFGTPNLEECKEVIVKEKLYNIEQEQSLGEVLEVPKRTEEEEAGRLEECAPACEADNEPKVKEMGCADKSPNQDCEDDTVESILSDDVPEKEKDSLDKDTWTKLDLSTEVIGKDEVEPKESALLMKNELVAENEGAIVTEDVPDRRMPLDEVSAKEETAKDVNKLEDDVESSPELEDDAESSPEEQGVFLGSSKDDPATDNEISQEDNILEEKVIVPHDNLLADEGLSLESVSETSFTLNDNTEDGKEIEMEEVSLAEDNEGLIVEKGTGSKDFMAELEDISSEDNEDFFADMDALSLKDSAADEEAVISNKEIAAKSEIVSTESNVSGTVESSIEPKREEPAAIQSLPINAELNFECETKSFPEVADKVVDPAKSPKDDTRNLAAGSLADSLAGSGAKSNTEMASKVTAIEEETATGKSEGMDNGEFSSDRQSPPDTSDTIVGKSDELPTESATPTPSNDDADGKIDALVSDTTASPAADPSAVDDVSKSAPIEALPMRIECAGSVETAEIREDPTEALEDVTLDLVAESAFESIARSDVVMASKVSSIQLEIVDKELVDDSKCDSSRQLPRDSNEDTDELPPESVPLTAPKDDADGKDDALVSDTLTSPTVDRSHVKDVSVEEKLCSSPSLASQSEESSELLLCEAVKNLEPLLSQSEGSLAPIPSDVEESSALVLSEVEKSSAPIPSEVEESSAPIPSKVEVSSVPIPSGVEESLASIPSEVEESSASIPSEVEEGSAPIPSIVEKNSVPIPSGVEESLASIPSEVEESSAPIRSEVKESSVPIPSEGEESSAPTPSKVEESSALTPSKAEENLVQSSEEEGTLIHPPGEEERLVISHLEKEGNLVLPSEEEKNSMQPPSEQESLGAECLYAVKTNALSNERVANVCDTVLSNEVFAKGAEELPVSAPEAPFISVLEAPSVSAPEASSVLAPEAPSVSASEATPVSAPEAAPVLAPEAAPVSAPETVPVSAPETVPVSVPEALFVSPLEAPSTPAPETVPVLAPESATVVALEEIKAKGKSFKVEQHLPEDDLDIPLETLKQEELDIPSEPLDEDDLDGLDEPLDNNDSPCMKIEEIAERDFEESALVIDEGESPPLAEMNENPTSLKTEAIKMSLGSEVSIKLVPAKSTSEPRGKRKEVRSVSIISKENLLNTPEDLQRRVKAQSLVKSSTITAALAKVPTRVSKHSLKAPIPDLTPLQTDSAKTTTKSVGRSSKSASLLKKSEQNATVKSLLKAPSAAGPSGNWPPKGKSAPRGGDDFRPFPSLPKDTVVIPTYYVSEQEKAQQPMNLSTSNDVPMISKSIPASQPLPANVVPSHREKRAPPHKNVLPPSATGPLPLPIQSMMPKMDNNMFPAMWSLFGPQMLSSQFLAAAAGASGTIPPFPMDHQKQNLLGAMLAASSAMPRLPIPPEMNVYNTALMQMQAQMDALMHPKMPKISEQLHNAPIPPDLNRYNAAIMQMQAQMDAFMPMPPNAPPMPLSGLPPVPPPVGVPVGPPLNPPVPPFAKAKPAPQVKPQATIHPQPKVPVNSSVQLANLAQSSVDRKTAQPAVPRKPGGRKTKFTPGSSPRLVKRPTSAAATAVAAGLKIPVPAVNTSTRPPAGPPAGPPPGPPAGPPIDPPAGPSAKPSSPVPPATSTPAVPPAAPKKFKVGSKLNSVVDKLLAGAGKQGSAVDLSATAAPMKSSSPVPPRKDTPPLKEPPPVKKVIQVTNALTIELENRNDARDRRIRPPLPALLPCKPAEPPLAPCELLLVDGSAESRGGPLNGCVSDRAATPVVLTPEQARKTVESSGLTVELLSRDPPLAEDDAMSVTCSLPLDKVSVMLDCAKKSPVPSSCGLPTLPPTLAAGGLEILPMDIANSATSTPKSVVPDKPIGANSISLGSNVSLTLAAKPASQETGTPLEDLSAVEPCSPVAEEDQTMEPTPSPPRLEPVSSPLKKPSGIQDGETSSPDKEVPSLDLEVPEGLESSRADEPEDSAVDNAADGTPVAPAKALAGRKKFSFTVNSSFMMTLSDGQKLFTCDICSGVYQRAFSLKRHYLRSHINYIHLQERDISNCGIIVGNKMAVQTEPNTKVCLKDSKITVVSTDEESQEATNVVAKEDDNELDLPGLYRCYTCGVCFDLKDQLRNHLAEHRPSSTPQEEEVPISNEKVFTCEVCSYPFRHKKNYIRHMDVCSKRKLSSDQSEWLCLFCNKTFTSAAVRSRHLSCIHRRLRPGLKKSRRSKVQKHTCMYCGTSGPKFNDLNSLLKHMCTSHQDVYFGCLLCEERYTSNSTLEEHMNATHIKEPVETVESPELPSELLEATPAEAKKGDAFQFVCTVCKKMFVNEMNMNRHKQLAHGGPRGKKKRRANATRPPTPPVVPEVASRRKDDKLDPEALFYSRLSMQIRDNLMHHLDGKLDSQEVFEREEEEPLVVTVTPAPPPAASVQQEQPETLDPHKVKNIPRRRSSESYLRLTWDKFNVHKGKDSRNSVSSFIRDMSHIDIPTQLMMRRNMKRLSEKDASKLNMRTGDDVHRLEYPSCIALTQSAEGARSLEAADPESLVNSMLSVTVRVEGEEPSTSSAPEPPPKTALNPAEDFLNGPWKNKDLSNEVVELSGEWVRPKHYLCAACDSAFMDNLYEMEDHQYLMHPNVWGTYWEFEESSLVPFKAAGIASPSTLYKRSLKPTGSLISAPPHPASQSKDIPCTKCSRLNHSVPELHRHMLDCGGDTTWHLTMVLSSPVNGRRNRKWRPFGSRRRRQQGRRGLKRNIPNTPQRPKTNQPKTRGGDAETIQRMIANLPAKRSTRRVIQFKEDEVKTRSQATMASTRLLRKRFKVPFPVSQSPLHKASRALLGRCMASSSSKPGHMPRARPLRASASSTSAAAAALAAAAATARKASKVQYPPKTQPQPQEVAHTLVEVQTLIPAKVKKLAKVGEKSGKAGKAKISPNTSMEAIPSTSAISVEDLPEGLLAPGKGEKKTDVILEAMRQAMMSANFHLCSVCGRMFNNSANRDRHFRVCSAQAEEGMPRLRKEPPSARSRQASKNSDIPVLSPSTAVTAAAGDSSKAPKSGEEEAEASAELSASGKKKKKKRTIVGIRKSLVKSEESGGGLVVTESFLVRVDSSSNETSETEAKDKVEDELSDDVFVSAETPKKKESKKKGAKRSKVEPNVETPSEEKKKKKKTKLVNEEEAPVKKLTRSKQASPQKVPVMRVDRSLNPDIVVSGIEVTVPGTTGGKTEEPPEADPDNLDFEELLNTMDAEEIKQLDIIVPETPSSDADDDIPLGEQIPIWKKEAEAQEDLSAAKPKKGSKRRSMDVPLPAGKKTRSSSLLTEAMAEELVEAVEVEVEEPKKNRAAKSPGALKGKKTKSQLEEDSIAMPPPSVQRESPKTLAKSRRRSSVMKVAPPIVSAEIADVVDEPKPENVSVKGGKKKGKAAAKSAEIVTDVVEPSPEPEKVVSSGKKKPKAAKQTEVTTESESEELTLASKNKIKGAKVVEEAAEPVFPLVVEAKPATKKRSKNAAKAVDEVVPTESAVNDEVSPVMKKKSKAGKSADAIQPGADVVADVKPPTKKKKKASKLAENTEEHGAEVKPVSKRKAKGAAKLIENVTAPEPEPVLEEQVIPPASDEPSEAAVESMSVPLRVSTPVPPPAPTLVPNPAPTPVSTPVSKKRSKAAKAVENLPGRESVTAEEMTQVSKKKSKSKPAEIVDPDSGTPAEDLKSTSKKKSKAVPKPTEPVIEPDPNLVGELTPRNRKRIQPLEGDVKKNKAKIAENPSSPAVAAPDVSTTPPVTTKKGKATEEMATTTKEASLKEPEKKDSLPVKRKGKKRPLNQGGEQSEEKMEVSPESPKVNRKRARSSLGEDGSKTAPKGRGKKKVKIDLDTGLNLSVTEEPVPAEPCEKPKAVKKKAVLVKTETEEPVASTADPAVAPPDVQVKPKKKSKSKTSTEPAEADNDLVRNDSEPTSGVTPISETEQAKSSECAVAPTTSTPMDPPAANSPTPGEQPDQTPKKRKSSIGSQFFCELCQRHYSTAYNLTKHLSSLSHRALLRGTQTSEIVAALEDEKSDKSEIVPKTGESDKADEESSVLNEDDSKEKPFLEIRKDPLKEPTLPTSDIVGSPTSMDDKAESVVFETTLTHIQPEEPLVQNKDFEEVVPLETSLEQDIPKTSNEPTRIVEGEPMATEQQPSENTPVVEVLQGKLPEPALTPLPEPALTPLEPVNPMDDETLPVPNPVQASLVHSQTPFQQDYVQTVQNPVQDIQGYPQESYAEQQYNCYENQNWQGGDSGWGPWRIPDASDELSSNMGFGLGSILDSVNQVLAGDGGGPSDLPDSVYTGYALNEIQNAVGATDEEMAVLRQLGEGSFEELVGAPGSVMWPPAEETQLLDLDNQRPNQPPESEKTPSLTPSTPPASRKSLKSPAPLTSAAPTPSTTDAIPSTSSRDDTRSPVSMMPRPKTVAAGGNSLNELYEDRQMWCPSCHRRFLGLQAMKAHMAQHHSQNQRVERKATLSAEGSSEHRIICEICREMVVDQVALELHMEELHSGHNDPSKAVLASPSPGAKSRVLRMQMSHALGGLLDRALKNYLSKSTTGAASSVDTDRSRFTLGLLNKLALRHQANAANQRESPRSTPNPLENDGDGASSHSGSTTPTNLTPKRRNSRTEPLFVQYQGHPCPHCPEKFMSDAFVKRHISNAHAHLLTPEPTEDNLSDPESRATSPMEFCADPVVGDDGAFLCSACGINFKSPSEVLEHQRAQHPQPSPEELARSAAENDDCAKPDTSIVRVIDNDLKTDDDLDSAEIAEKVSEFQQRVTNPLKGRSLLTKELKNKKIALAVESALLEHTAEVQVIAEAALRELGPCRKSSKSSTKESPKWGIDAVKFTVAKEPALIGAYGPVSEQESRLKSIPIVRKTPSSAPRFSFAERKKLSRPSTEVKPVKEKMEIYEFDESPRVEPLIYEMKREVEDKSRKEEAVNKEEVEEKRSSPVREAVAEEEVQPVEESPVKIEPLPTPEEPPKKAPVKKRQSSGKRKHAPGKDEATPSKVAKGEKKKILKKRKSDQESSKSSEKPRAPRADGDSSGRVRKQRRASTHDATDYSVFDFSSDESSMGAAVDVSVEASAIPNSPRARRESVSPPKKATPSRVQELVEEDWTWLDDSESEKEKRKKMARRKRTKKKSDSPKKQSASRDDKDGSEEAPKEAEESAPGTNKRRKRSEASSVAGSSGESAR